MIEISVTSTLVRNTCVVEVGGTIDTSTCGSLEQVLEDEMKQGRTRIVLDMKHVGFVNSAGWGMMMEKAEKLVSVGGSLSLAGMQPDVSEIFGLLGLGKVIHHVNSVEDAV